jgi:GNAT superfamily N-acetyltransferase
MSIAFRRFRPGDAAFCFRCRAAAFIVEFRDELSPAAIAACVNAYLPEDYVRMAGELEFFVVEERGAPAGFVTIRRAGSAEAEIPLLYIDFAHLGRGLGTRCLRHAEQWIAAHWPQVATLFLDTIIPRYNGGFYRRLGLAEASETTCEFPGASLPAVRFRKRLRPGG